MRKKPPVLSVNNYSVSYYTANGPLRVLDDISLNIYPGEVLGLVGESGSGKSTLALGIMRALHERKTDESGEILLAENSLTVMNEEDLKGIRGTRVTMVFQDPGGSLNPTMTLGEHFVQLLDRHRNLDVNETKAETQRLLKMVELSDPDMMVNKYPHEVSGGEKQRVVIALAFACDPELILFDEPTSALDATTAINILDLFRILQKKTGVSALFISHDLGVIREIAHRVLVMYAGRLLEMGRNDELFTTPKHPYTRALLGSLPKVGIGIRNFTLNTIPGALPDRTITIDGCIFANRCDFVMPSCRLGEFDLKGDSIHKVACPISTKILDTKSVSNSVNSVNSESNKNFKELLIVNSLSVHFSRPDIIDRILNREIPTVHAVNEVSLKLRYRETLGLVGESGCGKSSLARALVGLRKFKGRVSLGDQKIDNINQINGAYRKRIQIIFQNPDLSLNPRHNIATILSRPLKLYQPVSEKKLQKKISELMNRVNLPNRLSTRFPYELSGGEKQRVAIARALAAEPDVIICDEITSGLDASVQASIVNLLQNIQRENGVSYLFITHDLNLLRFIADRVAIMYLGEIIEIRDIDKLGSPPYHPYTEALLSSAPIIDPNIKCRKIHLRGIIPSRTHQIPGCPFETRCPRVLGELCRKERPETQHIGLNHQITCHLDIKKLEAVTPIWSKQITDTTHAN